MLHAVGERLPEYRIRAFNNATDSTNRIHDDECARHFGFRGGLVPGVSVFAYMSRSLVEFAGRDWLERGSMEVRFTHPVYEGEEVRINGSLSSISPDGTLSMEIQASNASGMACASGVALLPLRPVEPQPRIEDFPAGCGPPGRSIGLDSLQVGEPLTPMTAEFTWKVHWEYCQKAIRDHHPIYHQIAHPGWVLSQANAIMAANYDLPPWIHVSSLIQNHRLHQEEAIVETRGRVEDKFERKGHHFVVVKVAVFAREQCLAAIRHTAIFRIAPRAA